ncbi:hypothetical protein [Absidia glauca]|uniref:Uncharacterized protein n=1 Tax=Absidia glauca TaxID=4829 RepID=A0A168PZT4_ABSGL|nr:hypothetical protein [Absidia glauca]
MKCPVIWQGPLSVVYGVLYIAYESTLLVDGFPIIASGLTLDLSDSKHQHYDAVAATTTTATTNNEVGPHSQNVSTGTWTNNDAEDTLEEQLKDDQMALQRMVLILSLVGGLGALAVVITGVMFIRIRRWKQWTNDKFGNSASTDDRHTPIRMNRSCQNQGSARMGRISGNNSTRSTQHGTERAEGPSSPSSTTNDEQSVIHLPHLPSAASTILIASCRHRPQQFLSITPQQGTPEPSAPSAKELTSYRTTTTNITCTLCNLDEEQGQHGLFRDHGSTGLDKPATTAPEAPPPAYTPGAPPLYDRSLEATDTNLTLLRRHSQT